MFAKVMKEVELNLVGIAEKDRRQVTAQKLNDALVELVGEVKTRLDEFLIQTDTKLSELEFNHSFVMWAETNHLDIYLFGGVLEDQELIQSKIPINKRMQHSVMWLLDPKF